MIARGNQGARETLVVKKSRCGFPQKGGGRCRPCVAPLFMSFLFSFQIPSLAAMPPPFPAPWFYLLSLDLRIATVSTFYHFKATCARTVRCK
jgi:hypothetical protein